MSEPRLDARDLAAWTQWQATALLHSKTRQYQRRIAQAQRVADDCLHRAAAPIVMWSGGKDSTVMAHLLSELTGSSIELLSEKDDLDYPGELEYVEGLASTWGAQLRMLKPPVSPALWITEHASDLRSDSDFHSRAAELSKACFYGVVEQATAASDVVFLGLRSGESRARALNRATHGLTYRKHSGQTICCPIGDWDGIDVYAYALAHGIELLPVYHCIGLMHARDPWRVRKSWWLPGASGRHGGIAWLRHYWPSLYRQLLGWFGDAQGFS